MRPTSIAAVPELSPAVQSVRQAGVRRPLVSMGVPAYNVERFLARALDSLLAQTVDDFELIISDNASTDGTPAICEEYARRDPRVRYIRQERNIGAPRNWNALVHAARGTYFKWASATDFCAPTMLERCVSVLEKDPSVVLCYGRTQLVDELERPIRVYETDDSFEEASPSERFARVSTVMSLNNAQCGVIRLDVLRQTRLDRLYPSGDMSLMAELSLYGRFTLLPDILLFRRQSRATFTSMQTPLERQRVYDPTATAPMKLLLARRHADNIVSITRAPLSVGERLRAYRAEALLLLRDRARLWRELVSTS